MSHWSTTADAALAPLFVRGAPAPTREQIRDAYPFGDRTRWPYRVWGRRIRAWQKAHAAGLARPMTAANQTAVRAPEYRRKYRTDVVIRVWATS
jgi:hypothetical protein